MKKILIAFFSLIMGSCAVGKQGVYFEEMDKKPTIEIKENAIIVTAGHSIKNSALVIYHIDYNIDKESKQINLKGYQKLVGKEIKNNFELTIEGISKAELNGFEYYWLDPDGKKTLIQ